MAAHPGNQHHLATRTDADVRRAVNLVRILGKSHREVARELGVHHSTVQRWLSGTRGKR